MSQWPVPEVPNKKVCIPSAVVRVIVLITIIFALMTTVVVVAVLIRHGYQVSQVAGALGAVATMTLLIEQVARRLTRRQRPDTA